MGRVNKRKHYYQRNNPSRIIDQRTLSYQKRFVNIKKEDIRRFLIPVVKEIGKAVYPPAAMTIELLYQLYDHAGAIKEVGSAIADGDYKRAVKATLKEATKEATESGLDIIGKSVLPNFAETTSEQVSNMVVGENDGQKEVVNKVVKGAINGVAESINEEIADKLVDEVIE